MCRRETETACVGRAQVTTSTTLAAPTRSTAWRRCRSHSVTDRGSHVTLPLRFHVGWSIALLVCTLSLPSCPSDVRA
eukprot:2500495-Rhodomonas_salina.1